MQLVLHMYMYYQFFSFILSVPFQHCVNATEIRASFHTLTYWCINMWCLAALFMIVPTEADLKTNCLFQVSVYNLSTNVTKHITCEKGIYIC